MATTVFKQKRERIRFSSFTATPRLQPWQSSFATIQKEPAAHSLLGKIYKNKKTKIILTVAAQIDHKETRL
jgi:hypothetical protein